LLIQQVMPKGADCQVFLTRFSAHEKEMSTYEAWLSDEEKARMAQKVSRALQVQCLLSFALRRKFLSEALSCSPSSLQFGMTEKEKPFLLSQRVHFNVSHSDDYWAIAIDFFSPVGIDVEWTKRPVEALSLAERFFNPTENEMLKQAADPLPLFWKFWTAKEALLKASGEGIVGLPHAQLKLNTEGQCVSVNMPWELFSSAPIPYVQLSVAFRQSGLF